MESYHRCFGRNGCVISIYSVTNGRQISYHTMLNPNIDNPIRHADISIISICISNRAANSVAPAIHVTGEPHTPIAISSA